MKHTLWVLFKYLVGIVGFMFIMVLSLVCNLLLRNAELIQSELSLLGLAQCALFSFAGIMFVNLWFDFCYTKEKSWIG